MADLRDETRVLLERRPEMEEHLQSLLAIDAANDTWDFADIPFDSGAFGEIVSRGLVEKTEDGKYKVSDRGAIEAVLEGEATTGKSQGSAAFDGVSSYLDTVSSPRMTRREAWGLGGVLSLVVVFRLFPLPAVFRGGDIVLSANDPYYYRYLVETVLAKGNGPLDLRVLSQIPVPEGEPLLVAALWWASALVGGGTRAAGLVLSWYPVVAAVLTGVFLYVLAVRLTNDVRVGLATVGLLAITPVHAIRTGLGYGDHHAFDYLWLALTALLLVVISDRSNRDPTTWGVAVLLGGAIGAQTLAWEAGPLLLVPVGLYLAVRVLTDVRDGISPANEHAPILVGLGIAALISHLGHVGLNWHSPVVAYAPALLLLGAVALVGISEGVYRIDGSVRLLAAIEVAGATAGLGIITVLLPIVSKALGRGIDYIFAKEGIAETRPLFAESLGGLFAPAFQFGFVLLLALPYMCWVAWRVYRGQDSRWLVPLAYSWLFFLLALVQVRFAGELSLFTALFAGFGFVHLLSWVDLAVKPAFADESPEQESRNALKWPGRREFIQMAGVSVGVGGLGALLTPIEHGQVTIDETSYRAAKFMRNFSNERGWQYPQNYVFSDGDKSRMYNYFVNGESRSYGYARSTYQTFLRATDPTEWYERLQDRVGFIVVGDSVPDQPTDEMIGGRLQKEFGVTTEHYRAVWTDESESRTVFTLVPGAKLTGPASANEQVAISGDVNIGGKEKSVELTTSTGKTDVYQLKTPLPGTYQVGDARFEVTEEDVLQSAVRSAFSGDGFGYWSFDEGTGEWAYDRARGRHAKLRGEVSWASGIDNSALQVNGAGYAAASVSLPQQFSISIWTKVETFDLSERDDFPHLVSDENRGILYFNEDGKLLFLRDRGYWSPTTVPTGEWTHIVATFDGTTRSVYVDGQHQGTQDVTKDGTGLGDRIRIGAESTATASHGFEGLIDEVRVFDSVIEESRITNLYEQGAGGGN